MPKVFKRGNQIYGWGVIEDVNLTRDGTLTGMTIEDMEYLIELWSTMWEMEEPTSERVYRMTVSLQTGKWHCNCPYSQVDVCSHVVALLIHAVKRLDATVPADDLPIGRRSSKPSLVPYRNETLRILEHADSVDSADTNLTDLLELANACRMEGDTTEALMVYLGLTEGLLYGLDYQAYSEHIIAQMDFSLDSVPQSTREPKGMDDLRAYMFGVAGRRMEDLIFATKMEYEPKMACLTAAHRLFMMTNPWGPSRFYLYLLAMVPRTEKYYEIMRRLHDPLVPAHTPHWREDPIGFRATMNLAHYQSILYKELRDHSLLDFYKQHYRDDIGTCMRYIQYLRYKRHKDALAVKKECRHLFPDDDPWSSDPATVSIARLAGIK